MKKFLLILAAAGFVCAGQTWGDSPKKKKKSPAATFAKLDSDKNGSLSKDEFKKLSEGKKKKPKNPQKKGNKLFGKLDTNSDGNLSKDEFSKLAEMKKKKPQKS